MNNLQDFKTFYLNVALPNLPSFTSWFNDGNFDKNIAELIEIFKSSYDIDPFDISDISEISNNLNKKDDTFVSYSDKKGSGVPNTLLNTHYCNFLKYRYYVKFNDLQDFVGKMNVALGSFVKTFQKERIKFNGNTKVASNSVIFGDVRDDYWTINKGSERELQYHIFKSKTSLGYGLGFNAQKSMNNLSPIENVSKFVFAFIQNKTSIDNKLKGYEFVNNNLENLIKIKEGEFILFGKTIPFTLDGNQFVLKEFDFLNVYYDLRYRQFAAYKEIYKDAISNPLPISQIIQKNIMKDLLNYKKQIILQGPPGTGKTREAKLIAKEKLGLNDVEDLKDNDQYKLIQFHPSYTYEDFVRGIVAESKGEKIEYKNVNKTLGLFAEEALRNYKASNNNSSESNIELWVDSKFDEFKSNIEARLPEEEIVLSGDITIFEVSDSFFKYAKSWQTPGYLKFTEFKKLVKAIILNEFELSNKQLNKEKFIHAHYRYTYYNALLKIFFDNYKYEGETYSESPKNYVLIIDEINRANLSSVLGELIYALEYRGEAVESIYAVEENNKLILPPNLYIIGTMNTADRSVGHIDYAIRRRFAFVDVLPQDLSNDNSITFDSKLFLEVKELFTTDDYKTHSTYLSKEFEPKDVALGHSYFIDKSADGGSMSIRLECEIKPILLEYIKDGVLVGEDIIAKIEKLEAYI